MHAANASGLLACDPTDDEELLVVEVLDAAWATPGPAVPPPHAAATNPLTTTAEKSAPALRSPIRGRVARMVGRPGAVGRFGAAGRVGAVSMSWVS
jgi:hypothetical protein